MDKKLEVDLIFDKLNSFHEQIVEQKKKVNSIDRSLYNQELEGIFYKINKYQKEFNNGVGIKYDSP